MVLDVYNGLTEINSSMSSSSEAETSSNHSQTRTDNVDPHNTERPSIHGFQTPTENACQEFNMNEDTVIYNKPEIFINFLNSDRRLGEILEILLNSFTMFIPKKENTEEPANLRPISIACNLTRQFHKLICNRVNKLISVNLNLAFKSSMEKQQELIY